ncbi:MAG: tungstate transport system substrate-binding protein [Gammaproteobacteria bacterium]|jgi:tungstate transport system substrate-binding protein
MQSSLTVFISQLKIIRRELNQVVTIWVSIFRYFSGTQSMFNRVLSIIVIAVACAGPALADPTLVRLATTTSTQNSGLTDYLLPLFTEETSIRVHTIAVGTGKALRLGREGDVDVVLVHARPSELAFVEGGFGVKRYDVMYNDFVIIGPESDPAKVASSSSVKEVLSRIHQAKVQFVSRGDDSGTHKRELSLWQSSGAMPDGSWYLEVGQGMGRTLQIASELDAYTMADRGTWLAYKNKVSVKLLYEGDPPLFNPYGIIAVNPQLHPHTNASGADQLIQWMISPAVQQLIADFTIEGEQLFVPSASANN